MPTLRYLHYDVFTSRPFEGNQLAVFVDGRGLSTAEMQRLTNEMNFAESTFLLPAEIAGTDIRMRIFTPSREMPMAGHPTVGTTFALAHDGVIAPGRERWTFGLNVGPTPVALSWKDGALDMAWMDQGPPVFRPLVIPAEAVVDAIGADRTEWKATGWPVEEGTCGAAYFYVPLATRAAVDACEPDGATMRRLKSAFPEGTSACSCSARRMEATVPPFTAGCSRRTPAWSRTRPPAAPAVRSGRISSGTASSPSPAGGDIVSAQGVKMGRPSRLHIRVEAGRCTRGHACPRGRARHACRRRHDRMVKRLCLCHRDI